MGLPISADALFGSTNYAALENEVRTLPFSRKIAWEIFERRRNKLHATICSDLAVGDEPWLLDDRIRRELDRLGPIRIDLRGLFSGNVNVGRLYLRVYPERRDRQNVFQHIQRLFGRRETDLYVVGIYNLMDDLDIVETSALEKLIERWWNRPILQFEATELWLLGSKDDLVLDGRVLEKITLGPANRGRAQSPLPLLP